MRIRRFEAPTLHEALQRVRREMGPDAIIFQTRKFRKGGFLGIFGREWAEITAGLDAAAKPAGQVSTASEVRAAPAGEDPPSAKLRSALIAPYLEAARAAARTKGGSAAVPMPPTAEAAAEALADLVLKARPDLLARDAPALPGTPAAAEPGEPAAPVLKFEPWIPGAPAEVAASEPSRHEPPPDPPGGDAKLGELERQIGELRGLVEDAIRGGATGAGSAPTLPRGARAEIAAWEQRLRKAGVEAETAARVMGAVEADSRGAAGEALDRAVSAEIARLLRVAPPLRVPGDGRTRTMAFIGPTGVGKTTTIAKLAARYLLQEGRTVALLTADTYRIAAVQQLRSYGEIMGIPVEVVNTPQELREAIVRQSDKDLLLLDTAGRSPQNAQQISELREFFQAAAADEVHLVLSVSTRFFDVLDTIAKFGVIPVQRLLLTKLDETRAPGVILDLAVHFPIPVAWVATGQGVPADLDSADRDRLARRIAGLPEPAAHVA